MGKRSLTQASMTRLLGGIPGTTLSDLLQEGMVVRRSIELEDDSHHLTGAWPDPRCSRQRSAYLARVHGPCRVCDWQVAANWQHVQLATCVR